jgi:pyruvate dehydrogenase E2 component (dihydrolipoamide acetyltransferase)
VPYRMELPDIGEGVVDAEVQQWFVAPGDVVKEDQPLVEVMTDKATVVIPSPRAGRIVKLFWNVGDIAKVHQPLVEIDVAGVEDAEAAAPAAPREDRETARPAAAARADFGPAPGPAARGPAAPGQKALATPAVRALARELGIDVNAVPGTGPGGRVTKDDLSAHRSRRNGEHKGPPVAAVATGPARPERKGLEAVPPEPLDRPRAGSAPPAGAESKGRAPEPRAPGPALRAAGGEERIPLRGVRKKIAENMARSKRTAAHFTFVEQADVTDLVHVKERIAEAAKGEGVKVTFLPLFVKAAVAALKKHPKLNATMDEERSELVLHGRYDIGVASATESGLIVPVIRAADSRSIVDLAREIERLAADTKAGRVRPDDLGRSTFTISSLGALGGLFATPVLNHPEVAILGIHRIRPTPVVKDGQVVVRDVMHVSVTSDHRVVDGHEAAAFAYELIRMLEDPNLLFMQLA